jgi:hypothetical protein
LFLVQRNAEFLAEHGFDALEIFFMKAKKQTTPRYRYVPLQNPAE